MTTIQKSIDSKIGPLIYNLEAGAGTNVQGITDADPFLGSKLNTAFELLWREVAELDKLATPTARRALTSANRQQRAEMIRNFKDAAGIDLTKIIDPSARVGSRRKIGEELVKRGLLIDRDINATFEAAVRMNVDLIRTIGPQYLDQVEKAVYGGLRSGLAGHDLKSEIMKINGGNYNRAKLIARDQLQKFNSTLAQSRQQAIGVEGYIWRTSGDERVRDDHRDNNGMRFSWNSPPPATGHPGEDIQCRCTAEPDLSNLTAMAPVETAPQEDGMGYKRDKRNA